MRLVLVLVVLAALAGPPAAAAEPGVSRPGGAEVRAALQVLHDWDDRRADAWSRSDVGALRALYADGSSAERSDVQLLRSYTARGLVVRRLVTQVFAASVLRRTPDSLALRVHDRVAGGIVEDRGVERPLGSSRPVVRVIELRRSDGQWQVTAVSDSARGPRAGRR